MKQCQSDLTDNQWQFIEKMLKDQRKRKYNLRGIVDAILYISKTGCQWRMLPKDFAPWQSVYYYFRKWKINGLLEEIHDCLVSKIRLRSGKKILPSAGIIDSQSIKTSNLCRGELGYDGGKKLKGVLSALKEKYLDSIKKIFADGGYRGQLVRLGQGRTGLHYRNCKM